MGNTQIINWDPLRISTKNSYLTHPNNIYFILSELSRANVVETYDYHPGLANMAQTANMSPLTTNMMIL